MNSDFTAPRNDDWPQVFQAFVESKRNTTFEWGTNDCCLFAADWVLALTGHDPADPWRGTYKDKEGGLKILNKHNGARMLASAAFPRVHLNMAQRGDLVAYKDPSLEGPPWATTALGVLDGTFAWFLSPEGLTTVPRQNLMLTAWAIGRGKQ